MSCGRVAERSYVSPSNEPQISGSRRDARRPNGEVVVVVVVIGVIVVVVIIVVIVVVVVVVGAGGGGGQERTRTD